MRTKFLAMCRLLSAAWCNGQQPVAPTTETVGSTRGDNWKDYNIVNSFETGYRFVSLSGNQDKYRSDVNYGNGVRLLASFFSMDSKNGHGLLFDNLVTTTGGLGGDPYEFATLRVDKNRLYDYNFYWRKNDYFNPGLTTNGGQGQNLLDTSYTMQDHNLTLFPQSAIRFTLGYTRSTQGGEGISSIRLFDVNGPTAADGNIFPVFSNVKILQSDYRLGGEVHWHGFVFNLLHGWEDFKDDTPFHFTGYSIGDGADGATSLSSFFRTSPYHGTSPYWQAGLFRTSQRLNINGRFTYTDGQRAFLFNENALGTNRFGALANQQVFSSGNGRRPVATGNANISFAATSKLTIASRTSVYNVRTEGGTAYLQYDNATQSSAALYYQSLGILTVQTDIDAHYQLRNWIDLHGGYGFSDRRITATPQAVQIGPSPPTIYKQTNQVNAGLFGFRITPLKGLLIVADGEVGRASRPFTPKSDADYHSISASVQYKMKRLQLSALTHTDYNLNSVSLSSYSSHARTYSGSATWTANSHLSLDGTFSKLHLDTLGGIAFFANSQFFPNQVSYYISNIYSATADVRYTYKRLSLMAGYSHVQDLGDGRGAATETVIGPNLVPFQTAQTFPLRFLSPMGRVSFSITERLKWNFGYQYYGYHEAFSSGENYLANTGYTSLLWSF